MRHDFLMGFTLKFHTLERELKGTKKRAAGFESQLVALEILQTEILTIAHKVSASMSGCKRQTG